MIPIVFMIINKCLFDNRSYFSTLHPQFRLLYWYIYSTIFVLSHTRSCQQQNIKKFFLYSEDLYETNRFSHSVLLWSVWPTVALRWSACHTWSVALHLLDLLFPFLSLSLSLPEVKRLSVRSSVRYEIRLRAEIFIGLI